VEHLRRLLDPASIAIVGLSADRAKHGGRVLSSLRKVGYTGSVWGVHPRTPEVDGVEMFSSLLDVPSSPDLVASAVPAGVVPGIVDDADAIGAGAVVVFAGGFAESGADGLGAQTRISEIAARGTTRILGPNSGGVIRPSRGLAVSFLTCLDRPADQIRSGPVGLVTQSGGTGSYIHNLAAANGGGLGVSISTGNEADIDLADGIRALTHLDEVRVIAVVLETVRDGPRLIEAIRVAAEAGKPVVACRIGTSERGGAMTATHTGALARPARILDGALASLGVTTTETPGELLDVAEVLARHPRPAGRRVGVVTHSGGVAILLSDLAERHGLELPQPDPGLQADLEDLLEHGVAANPLDMGGIIGGASRFPAVVDRFAASERFDVVLAVSTAHPRDHTAERARSLAAAERPAVHLWMAGDVGAVGLETLRTAGLPVTTEPRAAVRALAALTAPAPDLAGFESTPLRVRSERAVPLGEAESKGIAGSWGIAVPPGDVVTSAAQAERVAARIGGPVVVKVSSVDITHKTDIGGIAIGVVSARAAEAFTQVTSSARRHRPDAEIAGALVERQISGLEIIVGTTVDSVFGSMTLVGFGGIAAEALDPAMGLTPRSHAQAMALISRATGLATALGRLGPDALDALAETLMAIGRGASIDDIVEVEINPLVWSEGRWVALDALIVPAAKHDRWRHTDAPMKGER